MNQGSVESVAVAAVRQVLIGRVGENLRGVAVLVECAVIRVRFVYECVTPDDVASVDAMGVVIAAVFDGREMAVDVCVEVSPRRDSLVLKPGEEWAFARREAGPRYADGTRDLEELARHEVGPGSMRDGKEGVLWTRRVSGYAVKAFGSLRYGLLDSTLPHLVGVVMSVSNQMVRARFVFDGLVEEDEGDVAGVESEVFDDLVVDVESGMFGDFGDERWIEFVAEDSSGEAGVVLRPGEWWVYARKVRTVRCDGV